MIYTPVYGTPRLPFLQENGGFTQGEWDALDLASENIAGVVREVHKDSLIYGTGISRICQEFEENVVKLIVRRISQDMFLRSNAGLRGKSAGNHGDIPG
jgi:hypothetical protein